MLFFFIPLVEKQFDPLKFCMFDVLVFSLLFQIFSDNETVENGLLAFCVIIRLHLEEEN